MLALNETDRNVSADLSSEEEEPPLCYRQMCNNHTGQLILAYNKKTLEYLCIKCIERQYLKPEYYQVYPQVVQMVKEKIQGAKTMIKFRRV